MDIHVTAAEESLNGLMHIVTVKEGNTSTSHRVTVPQAYWEKFSKTYKTSEELVRASFEFLLEREPKETILTEFDLPVIQQYFSEYEDVIA
jgi:hypothetical protein